VHKPLLILLALARVGAGGTALSPILHPGERSTPRNRRLGLLSLAATPAAEASMGRARTAREQERIR
jgi:hypothetical protein